MEDKLIECISFSTQHFLWKNAIFFAERLCAERSKEGTSDVAREQGSYILASLYFNQNKYQQSFKILDSELKSKSSGLILNDSRYLFAMCAYQLEKYTLAQSILLPSEDQLDKVPSGAAGLYLLGLVSKKLYQKERSIMYLRKSLEINPFLWTSFETLCNEGDDIDPFSVFGSYFYDDNNNNNNATMTSFNIDSTTPYSIIDNININTNTNNRYNTIPRFSLSTPMSTMHNSTMNNNNLMMTGGTTNTTMSSSNNNNNNNNGINNLMSPRTPNTPYIPNTLDLYETPISITPAITPNNNNNNNNTIPTPIQFTSPYSVTPKQRKKEDNSIGIGTTTTKRKVLFQTPETADKKANKDKHEITKKTNSKTSNVTSKDKEHLVSGKKRSSSLGGVSTLSSKSRMSLDSQHSNININNNNNILTPVAMIIEDDNQMNGNNNNNNNNAEQNGEIAILTMLSIMGNGYKCLSKYQCNEAIEWYKKLTKTQMESGFVLTQIGKAYYEQVKYKEAKKSYEEARKKTPYNLDGLDIYSTLLWHMKLEIELTYLAQEIVEIDRSSPIVWCVVGNSFSLQKEHESAIKFFQRALQIEPNYTYAYTLCGHEFVCCDDLDKSFTCFRNAIRIEDRHYNAWYGLAMIYYRQEKFELAEYHFKKAIQINQCSSVLYCYLGMVLHSNFKYEESLEMIDKAILLDPKNSLAKFKRCSVLVSLEQFEIALKELHTLRELAPKEPPIYFLLGKIYKKLKQPDKAMIYFTTAMDLDTKNVNTIKNAIEKLHIPDEEDDTNELT